MSFNNLIFGIKFLLYFWTNALPRLQVFAVKDPTDRPDSSFLVACPNGCENLLVMDSFYDLDLCPVWPDWAIYWTLGNFLKPLATINLSKSLTFLGNFCKDVKIIQFSIEIIFGQIL